MSVAIHVMPRSLTVILNNKPHMIGSNNPHYSLILDELVKTKGKVKEAFINKLLNPKTRTDKTTKRIKIIPEKKILMIDDQAVPEALRKQYLQLKAQKKSRIHLTRFWDRLKKNPSQNSQAMLFDFLMHNGHTIMADGRFTAYRNVTKDFKDHHTRTMDNSIGKIVSMPRDKVVEDPNQTCSSGLHCCAFGYLRDFNNESSITVEVLVDPADVVSVPVDYNAMKMRVCKFEVYRVVKKIRETPEIKEADDPKPLPPEELEKLQTKARKEVPKKDKSKKKAVAKKQQSKSVVKKQQPLRDANGHFISNKKNTKKEKSKQAKDRLFTPEELMKELMTPNPPKRDAKGHFISNKKKLKVDTKGEAKNGGLFPAKQEQRKGISKQDRRLMMPMRDAKGHFISAKKKSKKK